MADRSTIVMISKTCVHSLLDSISSWAKKVLSQDNPNGKQVSIRLEWQIIERVEAEYVAFQTDFN